MSTATLPAALAGCTLVTRRIDDDALADLAARDRARLAPRGSRKRMCRDKKVYGRRAAARQARLLRENQGEDVHAYECPACGNHHVGHRPVAR